MLKRSCAVWVGLTFVLLVSPTLSFAEDGPVIPGFERFHSANPDAASGHLLLNELNCRSCHQEIGGTESGRVAPILTNVGSRIHHDYLREFIADPHQTKPGTVMPGLFASMNEADKSAAVDAVAAFLASTGSVTQMPPNKGIAKRGEQLFHTAGCLACHNSRKDGAKQLGTSVPLVGLEKKYTVGSLTAFLKDPHAVRPSGRMPNLNLSDKEAGELASYFLKDVEVPSNVSYAYYEFDGSWDKLPDFSKLTPKTTGSCAGIELSARERNERFAFVFEGYINVPVSGPAVVTLGSDDGSRVLIDGKEVVNVDGIHPHTTKKGKVDLQAGVHKVTVEYFEQGGEETLKVEFKCKQVPQQALGNLMRMNAGSGSAKKEKPLDPTLIAKGRGLFSSMGCAACHEMEIDGQKLASTLKVPVKVQGTKGCLSPNADGVAPLFNVTNSQRTALAAAMSKTDAWQPNDKQQVDFTMASLNCYACHSRDKVGGPETDRNSFFTSTIPEMGDEGRIPPPLDAVGDKLNDAWLKHVMDNGANDRPYMKTRMPKFGSKNVAGITQAFAKLDRKTAAPEVEFQELAHRIDSAGRKMVGSNGGLGCVKCHYFGKYKATGIQAMDLTTMSKRLRKDWFQRYLINPQEFRPGTRMPTGFPGGVSVMPEMLDGKPATQVAAIWNYLKAGNKARLPSGLGGGLIELLPKDEPIIYRNFIEGLSPRGIAVGYPEEAHQAWDAEQFSIGLIWHGSFMDASRHWNGRGQGFQGPLGDHLMTMVKGQPFAKLESGDSPWPKEEPRKAGYRFKGYRLDPKGRPSFRYEFNGMTVEDFAQPIPTKRDTIFKRTLKLSGNKSGSLYFRAARADSIDANADGSFLVDKAVKLTFETSTKAQPVVREINGKKELLVPIQLLNGSAMIEETIDW